ncbi:MAG: ATP-binding protein [Actinomycetota bacterium]
MEQVRERSGSLTRPLTWARVVWIAGMLGAIAAFVLGLLASQEWLAELGFGIMLVSSQVAFISIGALIVARQPANRIGLLFMAIGAWLVVAGLTQGWAEYGLLKHPGSVPFTTAAAWIGRLVTPLGLALFIPAFFLFPDGRPPSPRWRPVMWAWCASLPVTMVAWMAGVETITVGEAATWTTTIPNPTYIGASWDVVAVTAGSILAVTALATVAALVARYRRSRGDERQQVRWLMVVGVAFFVGFFVLQLVLSQVLSDPELDGIVGQVLFLVYASILLLGLPLACGVAILKYRLYDLDIVIRKAVVAAVLTLFVGAAYAAIVTGLGMLAGSDLLPRIAATAVVAALFQPVRLRTERLANRFVYGHRATPYEVLARFSERVEGTYESDTVLPRLARVIAEGTGAGSAEVWLLTAGSLTRAAAWPEDSDDAAPVPLADGGIRIEGRDRVAGVRHQGEVLGAIAITKPPGEPITVPESELVDRLADQAGLVVANAQLTADLEARLTDIERQAAELRASAQRIVAAQDEERRQLERNIHDGAQQHLVALAVKLRLVRSLVDRDPAKASGLLVELRGQVDAAIDTLRALALGVYPPLLEEQGIAAALAAQYATGGLPVRMRGDALGRYPIEIEAAVYFCVLEALQNAAKYAEATRIDITLHEAGGTIGFEVADDGRGFDPAADGAGTGLAGMRDRLAVFGGSVRVASAFGAGTTVVGMVPAGAEVQA